MLLDLDHDLFGPAAAHPEELYEIVKFTVRGRHEWYPAPDLAVTVVGYLEENHPQLASWREYMMNAATAAAWRPDNRSPLRVTLENVIDLASDLGFPAVIVVENARGDGSFLNAVFRAYAPEIRRAVSEHWLEISHAGGCGDQEWIATQAAKKFKHVCRVLMVRDNDKKIPQVPGAEGEWPPKEIAVHVWQRHEVENYLPDAVLLLSEHPLTSEQVRHLRSMSEEQQRWIDVKKGIAKGPADLFSDLDEETRELWQHGFAGRFLKPLVPEHIRLTTEDFDCLGEDAHKEFGELLDKIRRVL
jgi:hypothetical protein